MCRIERVEGVLQRLASAAPAPIVQPDGQQRQHGETLGGEVPAQNRDGLLGAPLRGAGKCGEGRGFKTPFSFRLRRKENAPFDGVREKALAAQLARRASWRKCGGLPNRFRPDLPVSCRVRSTLAVVGTAPPQLAELRWSSLGGKPQGLSSLPRAFRFAMRYPAGYRKHVAKPPQPPGCGSKREAEGIRKYPQLS